MKLETLIANKGRRVLLVSDHGKGKTSAIAQLARKMEIFVLDTDGNYLPYREYLPADCLDRVHIEPIRDKIKFSDTGRVRPLGAPAAWQKMITLLQSSWTDSETKENFGNIAQWKGDRCIVIDTISNLETPAWNQILTLNSGSVDRFKYRPRINDWQDAIDLQAALIKNLCQSDLACHIIFSTHLKHLRVSERPTEEETQVDDAKRAEKKLQTAAQLSSAEQAAANATGAAALAAKQRADKMQKQANRLDKGETGNVGTVHTFEQFPNILGNTAPKNLGKDFDFVVMMERKGEGKPRIRTVPRADVSLKAPSSKLPAYLDIEDGLYKLLTY